MIRIFAALVGLFLLSSVPAKAQNVMPIPQDVIQQAIDARLPFTARSGKWFEFTFLPGNTVNFHADGTVTLSGKVKASLNDKVYYTGQLNGTANLRYSRAEEAFFLDRPSLNNLKGEFSPNTQRTGIAAVGTNWMLEQLDKLVSSKGFAPVFALYADRLENKPIFRLRQDNPVHRSIAQALNQPDVQLLVREKTLLICKAEACNNL
ncbi:MAG: DUF1439 domain-containing protein [Alphaproteobacteria bacterium]|nr:MAG: DUF1439 domain-containing protein [Alphaproteobacteria bacterium]